MKSAELDPIDLAFAFGLPGGAAVILFYFTASWKAFIRLPGQPDFRWSIALFWVHSLFAGHAMSTPIVGTYIAVILAVGRLDRTESMSANTIHWGRR